MTYPFVQAYYDYGRRTRPALAFVIHMAEGGATVSYLSKPNPNKVSVHYVVERRGRIVQMLREDRISGSLRPSAIRTTDDRPFTSPDGATVIYGATAAKRALERYWSDPNTVVLSCEVEGFAADGPSADQHAALVRLVADLRTRYPAIALLAHRDFADYKACPGKKVRWAALGGHYPILPDTATGDTVQSFYVPETRTFATLPKGSKLYPNSDLSGTPTVLDPGRELVYIGKFSDAVRIVAYETPAGDTNSTSVAMFCAASTITDYRAAGDDTPYSRADLDAAIAADRAKARIVWA